jgi:hypothetical protein
MPLLLRVIVVVACLLLAAAATGVSADKRKRLRAMRSRFMCHLLISLCIPHMYVDYTRQR